MQFEENWKISCDFTAFFPVLASLGLLLSRVSLLLEANSSSEMICAGIILVQA